MTPNLLGRLLIQKLTAVALACALVAAADAKAADNAQERFDDLTRQVNRCKGLTLSILKQIKAIDQTYRTPDGTAIRDRIPAARQELWKTKPLVTSFQQNAEAAGELISSLRSDPSFGTRAAAYESDINKYRNAVNKYYGGATNTFGEPVEKAVAASPLTGGGTFRFTGEATGTLGNASYDRPNVPGFEKQSTPEFGLGAKARWVPSDKVNVNGRLGTRSTVIRQEIATTDFAVDAAFNVSPSFVASGGFDLSAYNEKNLDANDFKDLGLFIRGDLKTPAGLAGNATIRKVSRSYAKPSLIYHPGRLEFLELDFGTTQLKANASLPVGLGLMRFGLNYEKKAYGDYDRLNCTQLNPSIVYELTPGGHQMGFSYEKLNHPNKLPENTASAEYIYNKYVLELLGGVPQDVSRTKLFYKWRSTRGGTTKEFGPSIHIYSLPEADEQGFYDFMFSGRSTFAGQSGSGFAQYSMMYRLYPDDSLNFDFAQLEWRKRSQPRGAGRYSNMNVAARFYTEASDDDEYFVMHPPHQLDVLWRFGWSSTMASALKRLSIGPMVGHRMYIDTEKNKKFDNDLNETDYLLQNPANSARVGLDVTAAFRFVPGITLDASLEWENNFLYNANPSRRSTQWTLRVRSTYQINSRFYADGDMNLHKTRADIDRLGDADRTGVKFSVRYLFDVRN